MIFKARRSASGADAFDGFLRGNLGVVVVKKIRWQRPLPMRIFK